MDYNLKKLYTVVDEIGAWFLLLLSTLRAIIYRFPSWKLLLEQLYEVGVRSLPVVAITGFSTGCVLAAQSFYQLGDKGLESGTGLLVFKAMLSEIGPVLTSFMVTGRAGSAMCAVIGSMKVTEQLDALRSISIDPIYYLVAPRILGSMIMLPLLTVFSALMGIYGGYLISSMIFHMPATSFFDPVPFYILPFDVWAGCIKGFCFGFLLSSICCYKGLQVRDGAEGVGKAITKSVVSVYSCILISNFLLTVLLNYFEVEFFS